VAKIPKKQIRTLQNGNLGEIAKGEIARKGPSTFKSLFAMRAATPNDLGAEGGPFLFILVHQKPL
jgi:hypothetical protein